MQSPLDQPLSDTPAAISSLWVKQGWGSRGAWLAGWLVITGAEEADNVETEAAGSFNTASMHVQTQTEHQVPQKADIRKKGTHIKTNVKGK